VYVVFIVGVDVIVCGLYYSCRIDRM